MTKFLLGTTMFAGLMIAGAAQAADMPLKAPPRFAPEAFSWSGFYVGVHGGAAWGTVESSLSQIDVTYGGQSLSIPLGIPISSHTVNGFLGGGQAGWNWQSGVVVWGVEGQFSFSDIDGTAPCVIILSCSSKVNWVATVAGRFGLAIDRALWYVKGGVAWADSDYTLSIGSTELLKISDTRFGVMAGAGVEYAFAPNWSAKIEYNYMDFGNESYGFPIASGFVNDRRLTISGTTDIDQKLHLIKAGINYRFSR